MKLNLIYITGLFLLLMGCQNEKFSVEVIANKEEITDTGYRYTPSTQSFLRGHHWLENINKANFSIYENNKASINFETSPSSNFIKLRNIPLEYLVPRLHYKVKGEPDDFDLFNLMLAEYSRNGLNFPFGREGDEITHFQTNLETVIPWLLEGDYNFKPNPAFKPLRFSIVNNCLAPGLWEFNASDKTGEIYHSWFNFPEDKYYGLVAEANKISAEKAKEALKWRNEEVKLDLDRLRSISKVLGEQSISVVDEEISYSSQGSRQKLSKGFVTYKNGDNYERPKFLSDLLRNDVKMSLFDPPGKYCINKKMDFNFQDFEQPIAAKVKIVEPLTQYDFTAPNFKRDKFKYIEIEINLPNSRKIILGNLPLNLMTQKEDFTLNGFGVGILSAGGFAERRPILVSHGFHPSFAYLAKETNDGLMAQNSHDQGLEQIFIRSYPNAEIPHWDITITSYERITDIVKYRIPISPDLIEEQRKHSENYITPIYFSYRDDNIR